MDKLKGYIESLKNWSPEADFGLMYSGVVARSNRQVFLAPSALKLSAAFAMLFIVLLSGFYFNSGSSGIVDRSPMAYIFEQEAQAGDAEILYIFSE